ncbi:bpi2 domain containing protein [Stylonychia lemnae]|uniref:Bpi2 domain containing protein n=1 Tax=Stylonychia lemnae TaxID=5949 RepID=A0A078AQI4_STYLE|nr:bpi2 domain containing protein [Stylonychia lemnae]|eukprot:CDW84695.1 bpi2 domain containing protein [Stylonychia lemnae]
MLKLLVIFTTVLSLGLALPSGIAAAIDQDVVTDFKNFAVPLLFKEINSMTKQDIILPYGKISNLNINVFADVTQGISINFLPERNAIKVQINMISGLIQGDFSVYKVLPWPIGRVTADGNLRMNISPGGINLGITIILQSQTGIDNRALPSFVVTDTVFNFDPSRVDIQLNGNVLDILGNLFVQAFKGDIFSLVGSLMQSSIPQQLQTQMNMYFFNQKGYMETNPQRPATPLTEIKLIDASIGTIQLSAGEYVLNTILYTLYLDEKLNGNFSQNSVPDNVKQYLNTSTLDTYFSGLIDTYGENQPCQLDLVHLIQPSASVNNDKLHLQVSFNLSVYATDKNIKAVELTFQNLTMDISLKYSNFTIHPSLVNINFGTILVPFNTVEDIDLDDLIVKLDIISSGLMFGILDLEKDLQIPKRLWNMVDIVDADLKLQNGVISARVTPKFSEPFVQPKLEAKNYGFLSY